MGLRAARAWNPANVGITGGTITGVSGVPTVLYSGGVPFIYLSSGSVAANGAISGITALPAVYPSAYCWFPANALATAIAAGWYYCTFSTTTAGVAFLNTYTSGAATIPSSPTAVTDGKGAFTSPTAEIFGPTITVPILGVNSSIRVLYHTTQTNNANGKTFRVRLSTSAGTVFLAYAAASVASGGGTLVIANTGSASAQVSYNAGVATGTPTADFLGTVNTGVATSLVLSLEKATATDSFVMIPPTVEVVQ
jgi:hypothetical protein